MTGSRSTVCTVCGKKLTLLQQQCGDVCESLSCRVPRLHEQQRIDKQRAIESREALRRSVMEKLAQESPDAFREAGLAAGEAVVMIVPSFSGALEPLPDERRARFEAHLDTVLGKAQAIKADASKETGLRGEHENYPSQKPTLPVVNACSTCRGYCCKNGRDHAFLNARFLAWRMLDQPEKTVGEIKAEYMASIPEQHFPNSCLFQSVTGCVLPRSIRGPTCNWFECTGIAEHHATLGVDPDQKTIAIAHDDEAEIVTRIGVMNAEGGRVEIKLGDSSETFQL